MDLRGLIAMIIQNERIELVSPDKSLAQAVTDYYIRKPEQPEKVIGIIGLNNIIWGAFCSAF